MQEEYKIYLEKIEINSIKESWIIKNLPNLYNYIKNNEGDSISEKIYLLNNKKPNCKCGSDLKFLSYKRGYREFCSKKCSNNDFYLINQKNQKYKETCLDKYGVENSSNSKEVIDKIKNSKKYLDYDIISKKIKETCINKYGVDNPSKVDEIKKKKISKSLDNYGVENPFESDYIKEKIKKTNIIKYGFDHPLKSNLIKNKVFNTNIIKYGVDNYTKTATYKEIMFNKYRGCEIKTNLNMENNYHSYLGLGKHNMICDNGNDHIFITNSHLYHSRKKLNNKQCTICHPVNKNSSFKELEIYEFIKNIYYDEVIQNYRDGLEIDIYLPELKIGLEFNGLYWHSELFKDKNYHLNKTEYFKLKGIRVIHIWEDDWDNRKDIIKSQLKNWLGKSDMRIYARQCEIKIIDSVKEYKDFLNYNHIQGYTSASIKIGLYYKDELVSIMTFDHFEGRKSMKDNEWNLSRFCNLLNTNIIGGASKLLNFFIKKFNTKRIISFADKSWSNGELYYKLGFEIKSISYPNYSYLIDGKRSNKQKWKKSNLIKMNYDPKLTESKIMEDNFGAYKIFDCGQSKFEKIL
jgi:hypothetical protein